MCSNFMINVLLVFVDVFVDNEQKSKQHMYSLFLISFLQLLDFWQQFINVIASDDDLMIDEMNII